MFPLFMLGILHTNDKSRKKGIDPPHDHSLWDHHHHIPFHHAHHPLHRGRVCHGVTWWLSLIFRVFQESSILVSGHQIILSGNKR